MFKKERIVSFIGARAGSKGFKNKNVADFAGKPLIQWTIEASRGSKYIDRTLVSTDGADIARIARQAGGDVPFMRPAQFATDEARLEDAVRHALGWLKDAKDRYDYVLVLQPTSPLRTTAHIDRAIEYYFKNRMTKKDTLVSVVKAPKKNAWLMEENAKGYVGFCLGTKKNKRRQALPDYYLPNGIIFFGPAEVIQKEGFYSRRTLPFVMEEDISIDVDTSEDLRRALEIHNAKRTTESGRI